MRFYLAHPFLSQDKIKKWQHSVELKTGILFINPFTHPESWEEQKSFQKTSPKNRNSYKFAVKKLVETDLRFISKSDGVVAVVDGNLSYGTIQEMVYAKVFKKHLFVIITNGEENHPWFRYHADKIFTSFKDLEKELIRLNHSCKNLNN